MFGRLIGKIRLFTRTVTLRCFSQKKNIYNKQNEHPVRINNKLKEFPVSIDKFNDLVKPNNIFVDKSLLLKELLNTNNSSFSFSRPQGWGKTINIDMLEFFFQADVDDVTGMPDFENKAKNTYSINLKLQMKGYTKIQSRVGRPIN